MAVKTNVVINGKDYYRIRETIGKDKEGKAIIKPFYGTCKKDAERQRDEWVKNKSLGLKIDNGQSLTQAMYIWIWNVEKVSGNKSTTFERYEGIYRNHIDKTDLGYTSLSEIDKLVLQQHYTTMYKNGKTYSQIKICNKQLNKFFRYCLSEGYLLRNPCFGIKFDSYKEDDEISIDEELDDEGKIETFSADEIKLLVNNIHNKKLRIIVKLALGTGLRQGEIIALNQTDVDTDTMTVNVTKTLVFMKIFDSPDVHHYELRITKPKTAKSKRKVPIPSELKKDFAELNRIRNEEKLRLGELYTDNELLFPSETGKYIDARNLLRSWKRALIKINMPYKRFHSLRHTFATQLIKNNVQLITVSRLLGHSTVKTTERYAHVLQSTKQQDVQSLNALFK